MPNPIVDTIGAVCAVLLVWCLVRGYLRNLKPDNKADPISIEDYLQKLTHITGFSTYEIFRRSAEDWHVSADRIDRDFKRYLSSQTAPYYVKDFVRRGLKHIDELYWRKSSYLADKRRLVFYTVLMLLFWGWAVIMVNPSRPANASSFSTDASRHTAATWYLRRSDSRTNWVPVLPEAPIISTFMVSSGFVIMFHRYDDFSPGVAFFKIPDRFCNLTQGINSIDNRYDVTGFKKII